MADPRPGEDEALVITTNRACGDERAQPVSLRARGSEGVAFHPDALVAGVAHYLGVFHVSMVHRTHPESNPARPFRIVRARLRTYPEIRRCLMTEEGYTLWDKVLLVGIGVLVTVTFYLALRAMR